MRVFFPFHAFDKNACDINIYKIELIHLKPRSHEGLGPCCDLCKTSHVVKSQVDLIRARDRS